MKALLIVIVLCTAVYTVLVHRADVSQYQALFITQGDSRGAHDAEPTVATGKLSARYFGTSTIVISDGETSIMIDGFFSRPSMGKMLFGRFKPDEAVIRERLDDAGIKNIAAVIPIHSHHDHAMDAAEVARQTGAVVLGSRSTAYIAEGWDLPQAQIAVAEPNRSYSFGDFRVSLIPSEHAAAPALVKALSGAGDEITAPLAFPARLSAFKEGGSYSVHIAHPQSNTLVHGSAGFIDGALSGYQADTVFLGVAGLGRMDTAQQHGYIEAVVDAVAAKLVVPIHWDDFTKAASKDSALQRMPWFADDFDAAMAFLLSALAGKQTLGLMAYGDILGLGQNEAPVLDFQEEASSNNAQDAQPERR